MCLARGASAQSVHTWNGGGLDANWSTAGNWTGGAPDGNDEIHFAGTTQLNPFNDFVGYNGYRIFFDSGAGAFTLSGNALTLFDFGGNAPKIENSSTSLQTINMAITMNGTGSGSAQEINPVNGDLLFGSTVALAGGTQLRIFGDNGKTVTFNGALSGTGSSVAINQNSNVVYGAANTYDGDTFVNAGALQFASGGSATATTIRLGDTSGSAPATLSLINSTGGQNIGNTVVVRPGSSGVKTINSTNTSGTNTYSGDWFLDADVTVSSDNSGATLAITGTTLDLKNQTMTVTGSGDTNISGVLQNSTGSGKLTKAGTGVLTLSTANTYAGATTINGGVVSIDSDGKLGTVPVAATPGHLTLNGGTLRHTSAGVGSQFLAGNRGIAIGASGGTIDIPASGAILIYTSGQITGAGNTLRKSGAGTLRVSTPTAITFSKLIVDGGLYQAAADPSFGAVPGSALADAITLSNGGGISTNGGFTLVANRGITLGTGGGRIDTPSAVTVAGIIAGSGALSKTGTNVLTLSGNNTFTGKVSISQGVVSIDSDTNATGRRLGAIPGAFVADQLTLDGGTIRLTRAGAGGTGLTATRGVQIGAGGGTFDVTSATAGDSLVYTGAISVATGVPAGTGTVTKTGANTFRLSTAQGFDKLVVLGGLWQANLDTGFGAVPAANLGDAITLNGGGISTNGAVTLDSKRGITIGAGGGTFNSSSNGTITSVVSGAAGGALNKTGSNTLTLTNANTFDGPTNIVAGRIDVHNNSAFSTGAIVFPATATGAGTLTNRNTPTNPITLGNSVSLSSGQIIDISANSGLTLELAGKVTGASAWRKDNSASAGTLILSNSTNDFSGGLTVVGGQLAITANNALGSVTGATTINSAASLVIRGGFDYTTAEPVAIGVGAAGNGNAVSPGAINNASGNNRFAGPLTLSNTSTVLVSADELELAGTIGGAFRLAKSGPGSLVLSNAGNTFSATTINTGSLSVSADGNLGTAPGAPSATNLIITSGAALRATSSFTLNSNRGIQLLGGSSIIDVATGTTLSYGGAMNSDGLDKRGTGVLQLSGASTHTGTNTVTAGTIRVTNTTGSALGTGPVVVAAAGTIGGTGSFTGTLTLNGAIAPGNSVGQITTGDASWEPGGSYDWEIADANDGAGIGWDHIQMGLLTISATPANKFVIRLDSGGVVPTDFVGNPPPFPPGNYEWTIVTSSGAITGFDPDKFDIDASNFVGVAPGGHFKLQLFSSDTQLRLVYVPEPGALTGVMLAAGALLRRRNRRRAA